ncbi:ABC transporter ATP-binding protein [Ramlibacter henchirensis]|uniref:ABC transporter ATP-binding protein n=1 Tax=Ramlibacter henchirensis TaxID=204072 RepID=A0A4Z0BV51_9BURK|nr:ABC transporter ATP-binding protein [Ramlibacter henchirensis]TFZ02592.1 ABC transporter ATP-binding protein [Ramlibacter henchirensis]
MSEIVIERMTCRYGAGAPAVDTLDLRVGDGEFIALLGPSGCGKTTTLRCIAGLEQPSAGRIAIGGQLVADGSDRWSVPADKRGLGMVFQSYALWPHMRVSANVAYPLKVRGSKDDIPAQVRSALALVGMEGFGDRAVSDLSGGQQQRVALARALASRPHVLLLDEPLSNLDAGLRTYMRRELRRIHREVRTTCVYVTHDQLEAATLSDRIAVMRAGRLQQLGTPREIFESPATAWVAEFVGFDNFVPGAVTQVDNDTALVQPPGWPTALRARTVASARVQPGRGAVVAFRSSSLQQSPLDTANRIDATVTERMFLGDQTELTLAAHGARLVAKVPGARLEGETSLSLWLRPEQAVVLPEAV